MPNQPRDDGMRGDIQEAREAFKAWCDRVITEEHMRRAIAKRQIRHADPEMN